jgi:hypothetical protein
MSGRWCVVRAGPSTRTAQSKFAMFAYQEFANAGKHTQATTVAQQVLASRTTDRAYAELAAWLTRHGAMVAAAQRPPPRRSGTAPRPTGSTPTRTHSPSRQSARSGRVIQRLPSPGGCPLASGGPCTDA